MAAAAAGRVGYEHHYDFSVDDDIVSRINHEVRPGKKTYFVEIKASFIIRRIDGGGDDTMVIDSETYGIHFTDDNADDSTAVCLHMWLTGRLHDYWMTAEEVNRFNLNALAFLRQTESANPSRSKVPVRANLEVCTVQQESEPVESVTERAIRAGNLIPLDIFHTWVSGPTPKSWRNCFLLESLRELPRIRVEDRDQALAMMEVCRICKRAPATGAQISITPACRHAFHSRCIVEWLVHKHLCPVCHSPAYHPGIGATLIIPTPP